MCRPALLLKNFQKYLTSPREYGNILRQAFRGIVQWQSNGLQNRQWEFESLFPCYILKSENLSFEDFRSFYILGHCVLGYKTLREDAHSALRKYGCRRSRAPARGAVKNAFPFFHSPFFMQDIASYSYDFLMNVSPHFGHRISIFPFPLGILIFWLHLGQV